VRRSTCAVPRAAAGETKRPVTCTVVPGGDSGGFPENVNVPSAATWIAGSVREPAHADRSTKLRIVRPLPESRNLPPEKTYPPFGVGRTDVDGGLLAGGDPVDVVACRAGCVVDVVGDVRGTGAVAGGRVVVRGLVADRAVEVDGCVVDVLDDVGGAGAATGRRRGVLRGLVADRAVEVDGSVVAVLDDVLGVGAVTGGGGEAARCAAGDRAFEVGNASLPTATPTPKRTSAVSAIAVTATAVGRCPAGPAAGSRGGGGAGGCNGCAGATGSAGGSTST
jgi:hypothetical protein